MSAILASSGNMSKHESGTKQFQLRRELHNKLYSVKRNKHDIGGRRQKESDQGSGFPEPHHDTISQVFFQM